MVEIGSRTALPGGAEADRFVAPAASMDLAEAEALAARLFGIAGHATLLTGERDLNFRIRTAEDAQFVLKLAHPAEPEAAIAFQNRALLQLEAEASELPVPRVVRTRDGRDCVRVAGCLTRVLTWLDGPLMHQRPRTRAMRRQLGALHARLHEALAPIGPTREAAPLLWDLRNMGALEHLLDYVDADRRALVKIALDRFNARAAPVLDTLPAQLIHNDLNPHNVIVSEDGEGVRGIIDFGDMVHAPRVCDVAIAAAYHVGGVGGLTEAVDYVAAYEQKAPLGSAEADILTDLIVSRLAMTVLITNWRATLHPENSAYILRNAPAAWAGLEAIVPNDRRLERNA